MAFPAQPRPQLLATGGAEKKLRVFDVTRASAAATISRPSSVSSISNSINKDIDIPTPSYEIGSGVHEGTIKSIVWGMDPNVLVTAADDKKIRWWDLRKRSVLGEFMVDGIVGSCEMNAVTTEPGSGVLTVAAGKNVYFFNGLASRDLLKTIKTPYEVASVALHSDRKRFVTGGSGDTWVRMYDFEDGKELGEACLLSFSPFSSLL